MIHAVENPFEIEADDIEAEIEEAEFKNEVSDESDAKILTPLEDPVQQKRMIEALLFASPEPISIRHIQNRLPPTADVGGILQQLQQEFKDRGVNLVRLDDVWAFRTATDIGPYLALNKKEEKKLSRAALETMAIIAYHQPVTRAEVENIRGVATNKGTLDVLMESGWIKPGRRRETPGRPVTWMTTNQFLDDFGVANLTDLPGLQELKASGLLDTRPAIDTIPGADLFTSANENTSDIQDAPSFEQVGEFDQQTDEEEIMEDDENKLVTEQETDEPDDELEEDLDDSDEDDSDEDEDDLDEDDDDLDEDDEEDE